MPGRDDMNFDFLKDVFIRVDLDEQEKKQRERDGLNKASIGLFEIYTSLMNAGFSREESMELVKVMLGGALER